GAYEDDDAGSRSGSSYVFERNVGGIDNWGEVAKLTASDSASRDEFGRHLAISGDTVVVGGPDHSHGESASGSTYVFERHMGGTDSWGEVAELTTSAGGFGVAVAISGDTVVAGAQGGGDAGIDSGSSYVFDRNVGGADSWGLVEHLTASDGLARDRFGISVAISGGSVVAGANGVDDAGFASGAAYAFERSCVVCGDGLGETPEECDDGAANSDLLPDACRTDCTLPTCGDLVVDTGEECDDANLTDNDGCDSNCTFTACGNGVVTAPEECDDGNAVPGDGCDVSCLLECFDNDGDGFGAPGTQCTGGVGPDCDDGDNLIWGTPGEAMNLTFTDVSSMKWDSPSDLGGTVVAYDVLHSPLVLDFRVPTALCVESNDGSDTTATDTTIPDANTVLYYLIRAENACPDTGQGSPGNDSRGRLRTRIRLCP
ncbi:MAG: DUF4215 domain-containing protein, partial [Acidobacteria bacterium]